MCRKIYSTIENFQTGILTNEFLNGKYVIESGPLFRGSVIRKFDDIIFRTSSYRLFAPCKVYLFHFTEYCSQSWAPCIRCMVTSSDLLDVGMLTIITSSGATIGREHGLGHALVIPDLLISKVSS